jgi:hypothetical protein
LRERRAALEVLSHLALVGVVVVSTAVLEGRFSMCGFIARERLRFCFRAPDSSHGFGEKSLLSFTNSHEHFANMNLNPKHSCLQFRIVRISGKRGPF